MNSKYSLEVELIELVLDWMWGSAKSDYKNDFFTNCCGFVMCQLGYARFSSQNPLCGCFYLG